ncbi:MAG: hypothetical protein IT435_04035 [Phycisphaerales bacterium]|nr:hypothetical protein [Phycisphaerales bacterium]
MDQRMRAGRTLDAGLCQHSPSTPDTDQAFVVDLLALTAECACEVCLSGAGSAPLLERVVHGLRSRGMSAAGVDAALAELLVPGPFSLLVADRLAAAIELGERTPVTGWIVQDRKNATTAAATAFRARSAESVRALAGDTERYAMPAKMRKLIDRTMAE